MAFRFFKIAGWTLMGWALLRALCARDQGEEEPAADGPPDDAAVDPISDAPSGQDLRKVRGIGPGIAAVLNARGITTWAQLAATEVADLEAILEEAGPRYRVHDPSTWPAQAAELTRVN